MSAGVISGAFEVFPAWTGRARVRYTVDRPSSCAARRVAGNPVERIHLDTRWWGTFCIGVPVEA